jgi:hypothetical protein
MTETPGNDPPLIKMHPGQEPASAGQARGSGAGRLPGGEREADPPRGRIGLLDKQGHVIVHPTTMAHTFRPIFSRLPRLCAVTRLTCANSPAVTNYSCRNCRPSRMPLPQSPTSGFACEERAGSSLVNLLPPLLYSRFCSPEKYDRVIIGKRQKLAAAMVPAAR